MAQKWYIPSRVYLSRKCVDIHPFITPHLIAYKIAPEVWNLILWYKSNSHKLLSFQCPHPTLQTNSVLCQTMKPLWPVFTPSLMYFLSPHYPHIEEFWPIAFFKPNFLILVCQDPKMKRFFSWLFFILSLLKQLPE